MDCDVCGLPLLVSMVMVNLLSLSVRGLHAPGKRHNLYRELGRLREDIVFLQETHLAHTTSVKQFSPQFPMWYYSPSDVHKGVAIGFHRGSAFTLKSTLSDPLGCFLFLKGCLSNMPCTLATLYTPNRDQAGFEASTLTKQRDFACGCILAGDFNTRLEPVLDTSQERSCISHERLSFIRKRLFDSQLIDVWRIIHPPTRDYIHFSQVRGSYSRIDYFFIDHYHLPLTVSADIGVMDIQ